MTDPLLSLTIGELSRRHPAFIDFIVATDADGAKPGRSVQSWLAGLSDEKLADAGMGREQVQAHLAALALEIEARRRGLEAPLRTLTILGGRDKNDRPEKLNLVLEAGDVFCIVGPTGSGKSRLLADIECLADGDTPSGRRILINGAPPEPGQRYASDRKLIAQLSQNMNFVVDLSVGEFVTMHADCRMTPNREAAVSEVIACANDLAGDKRIVIRNGSVADIIETSAAEKANLVWLQRIDRGLMELRHKLRSGETILTRPAWAREFAEV
jgi:hypothetical protein